MCCGRKSTALSLAAGGCYRHTFRDRTIRGRFWRFRKYFVRHAGSGRRTRYYGDTVADEFLRELEGILKVSYAYKPDYMIGGERYFDPPQRFTEEDVMIIAYRDLMCRWDLVSEVEWKTDNGELVI